MTNLENIVRPFSGFPSAPGPVTLAARDNPRVVRIVLGGLGGRSVTWTYDGEGHVTAVDVNKFRESSRVSEEARVENPDDPEQFVTFCRATRINLSPEQTAKKAPKTSTYDLSGGYHDLSGGAHPTEKGTSDRVYSFKYPKGGCDDSGKPPKGCV